MGKQKKATGMGRRKAGMGMATYVKQVATAGMAYTYIYIYKGRLGSRHAAWAQHIHSITHIYIYIYMPCYSRQVQSAKA